jgi:DNA invertase Pin-like site-specific DNA recombinase
MSNGTTITKPPRPGSGFVSHKIAEEHLQLAAALYIRQSSGAQLRDHRESTARQYGLKDLLVAFGWPEERVVVIDDDLGVSGTGREERPGFRRLLQLVTDHEVGIVLGLEMSRLARNSRDWHDLFEVCAIFHTLIADEDGVFDPQDQNDRLVLGLKGIIAEMELYTMKVRLERGRLNKAQRGELFHDVPVGYVLDERGLPQFDPDESARHVMKMFFELFESIGSSHGLFCHLAEHQIKLPFRANRRDPTAPIDWRVPAMDTVYGILKHPLYAGAYGYRRRKRYSDKSGKRKGSKFLPPDQWKVLIKDRHPAYITWSQYESNQRRLRENDNVGDRSGPVRDGSALLAGMIWCARCHRRLSPQYAHHGHARYSCGRHHTVAQAESCHNSIRCATLDEFVTAKVLEVLSPAGVDLSLRVIEDEQARREQLDSLYAHHVDQARYAVDLAERRFKHVDPANRLVASRLEGEWEAALAELQRARKELDQLRMRQPVKLSDAEREELRRTCEDVARLWSHGATIEERKQIVRLLLRRVEMEVHNNTERVSVRLHWSGGFESSYVIKRTVMQFCQLEAYEQLLDRVLGLTLAGKRSPEVASILEREGFRSPRSHTPISSLMVQKLLWEQPRCREELTNPPLEPSHWRSDELAKELGMPEKKLKEWVRRGWVNAIRRPFGRVWVICADEQEVARLRRLRGSQTGQGRPRPPEALRTPAPIPRKPAEN